MSEEKPTIFIPEYKAIRCRHKVLETQCPFCKQFRYESDLIIQKLYKTEEEKSIDFCKKPASEK